MDKWMNITGMGYVIALRYNVILVSLSLQQSMTFFPLRSQPPRDCSVIILNVYVPMQQVILKDSCSLPLAALLWSIHFYYHAKQ